MRILCVFGRNAYGDAQRGEGYEHANFLPALRALGHEPLLFESWDRGAYRDFAELNRAFVERVRSTDLDAVLCVLMGYELWTETLDLVRATHRAPLINWGTDDSWKYTQFARFIAPHLDCYATTSVDALERARSDGLDNVVLTQWAASSDRLQAPLPAAQCSIDVSFVGAAYGNRRQWIERLAQRGIEVQCFGHGWPRGAVATSDIAHIVRSSKISLNFADSGLHVAGVRPYRSRQIKARVFEVPGAGGCLLTERAAHVENFYRPEQEIALFEDVDTLAQQIRRYLADPAARDRVAVAGYERTRREHTYEQRFSVLLEQACAMRARRGVTSRADVPAVEPLIARHRVGLGLRLLRNVLAAPTRLLLGAQRGPRAARRLLFELSWRLAGAKTYSAAGWPGRLFYRES